MSPYFFTSPLPQAEEEEHKLPPHPTTPQQKSRKDYAPPPYLIANVDLDFDLREEACTVTSRLTVTPNYGQLPAGRQLEAIESDRKPEGCTPPASAYTPLARARAVG